MEFVRPSWFDRLTMGALALILSRRRRRRVEGRSLAQDEVFLFATTTSLVLSKGRKARVEGRTMLPALSR
jgi:hypothetical protein